MSRLRWIDFDSSVATWTRGTMEQLVVVMVAWWWEAGLSWCLVMLSASDCIEATLVFQAVQNPSTKYSLYDKSIPLTLGVQ